MAYLGQIQGNCQQDVPYTGIGDCNVKEGKTVALLITGYNALYPIDKATFISNLNGYVSQEGNLRMYPVNSVIANTINGGDINAPEAGFSGPQPTNLNVMNVIYQVDAGNCFYKEIAKLNKRKVRVFRVDDQGYIFGTVIVKGDEQFFAGYEATTYAYITPTDGTTLTAINLAVYYSANREKELKNMHAFEIQEVPTGLLGVLLQKGATTGTAKVVGACDGEDYTSMYGEDWDETMFVNASGANPTTVAYSSTTGLLTFTPATASYKVASASLLAAGDILGIEGVNQLTDLT